MTVDLTQIRIASPCPMSWESMDGDGLVRHCGECQMNVYNLAEMKEDEVRRLIETHEGRLCGRLARRRDGTFTVGACPRSLRRLGRQVAKLGGVVAGVISLFGCAWWTNAATGSADPPAKSIGDVITSWGEEPMEFLLGDIEIALPPPPTQGSGPGPSPPGDSV